VCVCVCVYIYISRWLCPTYLSSILSWGVQQIYIYNYIYIYLFTCMYLSFLFLYVCIYYIYVYIYMYISVCVYIYMYIALVVPNISVVFSLMGGATYIRVGLTQHISRPLHNIAITKSEWRMAYRGGSVRGRGGRISCKDRPILLQCGRLCRWAGQCKDDRLSQ